MAALMLTFLELYGEVGKEKFSDRTPAEPDLTEAKLIANRAYLRFINERDWTFLHPASTIVFWATTTTAAVTITGSGLIFTVAADTFYPSMIGASITSVTGEITYTIDGYTSAKVITVSSTAAADDGDTFTITADGNYALPSTCEEVSSDTIIYPVNTGYRPARKRSVDFIKQRRANGPVTSDPIWFAVEATAFVPATGQRRRLLTYPITGTTRTMKYTSRIHPDELTEDADFPIGGEKHATAILACVRAECDRTGGGTAAKSTREQEYQTELAKSFKRDNADRPNNLGYNGDGPRGRPLNWDRMDHTGGVSVS